MEQGTLSVVATPIGNLSDITYRAVQVLSSCDYILCEDTRVTGKLKERYQIETPLRRYDAHASESAEASIIEDLKSGKHVALVSDAGTPGISDPGVHLISRVREVLPEVKIESIPGPSALTAAVSIAGFPGNQFAFLGFAPQKKGRETFMKRLVSLTSPAVFFESPHRITKTLEQIEAQNPNAKVYLGRELTKLHEEMLIGTPAELSALLATQPVKQKGEFVVIVES